MRCFRCGTEIADDARFCGNCGLRASDPQAATILVETEDDEALLQRIRIVFAGEYDVEREVARGGMAVVFKATEVALARPIALKVLRPDLGISVAAGERFKREAQTVASLDHPNIIPVYRVGQLGGIYHIAMKFVEGRSLDAILDAQGALPVPVTLAVLRAATRGIAFAHDRGIVHRDVKGANILIDTDGRVMVSDFGVALRATDVTLTAVGTVIGTPAFMSPEQCAGRRAGPQSDQYSLGVVAFQMLAGAAPFASDTLAGMMQHHFFTPPPDIRSVRDDIPQGLLEVIDRALTKDPDRRFNSTREMLGAVEAIAFPEADRRASERLLRELARGQPAPKIQTGPLPPLPDAPTLAVGAAFPRPRRRVQPAVLAAAAVVLGGVGWWLSRADGAPGRPASDTTATLAHQESVAAPRPAPPTRAPASPAPAAPAATGKLRMLTSPPNAEILLDGRPIGVGSVVDFRAPVGPRQLRVQAPGYQPWDSTVTVEAGATHTLGRIVLRAQGDGP
ncbi:MAG TPA: protein kinase [Gemmatimonadales bacterium]|nr:protein kinase [Gemmatimonadales bacterium]